MSNSFKWCGKIAPKASIPELVQNMCSFIGGDGLKNLILELIKKYGEEHPISDAVDKYFEDNPIEPVIEENVEKYFEDNPLEPVINTAVTSSINEYFRENPISDDISKAIQEYFEQNPVGGFDLDKVFPVGSIYATEDNEFDPNIAWGGTWETLPGLACLRNKGESGEFIIDQLPDGSHIFDKYEIGAGEFKAGSASVQLKESQTPKHTHKYVYNRTPYTTKTIKYAKGTSKVDAVVDVVDAETNGFTNEGPDEGTYPLVSNVPIMNTPTYGVVYWRRTA